MEANRGDGRSASARRGYLANSPTVRGPATGLASIGDLCGHHCRYHHEAVAHGAIALFGIAATANQALSGFGNSTIWLIVVAFFISRGFIKTGLGVGLSTYSWRRSAKRPWA
jgi:hypothetical protein